jgi:hemoglobin-like flavoprotein
LRDDVPSIFPFQPLWFALQATLEDNLRDVYTGEVEEAWATLFQFLADKMLKGMAPHLPQEDLVVQIR